MVSHIGSGKMSDAIETQQRLSDEQMAYFDTFGFLPFHGLLADSIDRITGEFEAIWAAHGGGHDGREHQDTARSAIVPFPDQSEYLSSLLDDPRIHDIAASICGDDFNYTSGDGNLYVGDSRWHSDGYGTRPVLTFKMAFYLDPLSRDTGALRVIPGSHRVGEPFADTLDRTLRNGSSGLGIDGSQVPAYAIESEPGDVLVFNHSIKHASFGGAARRRMFTMNFTERFPDDKLQELRDQLGQEARFWIDRIHGEAMVRTAGPGRMVHLQQVRENDTHLADLTRELKKTMREPSRG